MNIETVRRLSEAKELKYKHTAAPQAEIADVPPNPRAAQDDEETDDEEVVIVKELHNRDLDANANPTLGQPESEGPAELQYRQRLVHMRTAIAHLIAIKCDNTKPHRC